MSRDGKTRTGAAAPTRQSGPADEITCALRGALDTLQAAFPASIAVCKELATHNDAAVRARARAILRKSAARASRLKGESGRRIKDALDQAIAELPRA